MASITVRKLDDSTKAALRIRAAHHRRSMEEEAREILRNAVAEPDSVESESGLGTRIRQLFAASGELKVPKRRQEPIRDPWAKL